MSFLELEDDPQATLELALAFIDACEDADGTNHSSSHSSNSTSSGDEHWSAEDDVGVTTDKHHHQFQQSPLPPTSLAVFIRDSSLIGYASPQQQQQPIQSNAASAVEDQPGETTTKRRRAHSVKRHRESRKLEVLALRGQAAQLEARLAHLLRSRGSGARSMARWQLMRGATHRQTGRLAMGGAAKKSTSNSVQVLQQQQLATSLQVPTWLEIAVSRGNERLQSETLNLKLKDALRRQILATKALEGVLSKKKTEGLALLLGNQKDQVRCRDAKDDDKRLMTMASLPTADGHSLLARLQEDLKQMYLVADSMVIHHGPNEEELSSSSSSSCSLHVNQVDSRMHTEVRSTTFVGCSFHEAGLAMWQGSYPHQTSSQTGRSVVLKQVLTKSSFQKDFRFVVDGSFGQQEASVHGTAYGHKFAEDSRFVFMWTAVTTLSGDNGPEFVEKGWVVASPCLSEQYARPSDGEPRPSSIVRTCYQAFSCHEATPSAEDISSSDTCHAKDPATRQRMALVIKWLSRKTRNYNQRMQEMFLDKY